MPVNCREGKIAQRDNSFKNCIHTMLIFILLSIFLIILSVVWKGFQNGKNHYESFDPVEEDIKNSAKLEGDGIPTTKQKIETTTSFLSTLETNIEDATTKEQTTMEEKVSTTTEEIAKTSPVDEITTTQQVSTSTEFSFAIDKEIDQSIYEDQSSTSNDKNLEENEKKIGSGIASAGTPSKSMGKKSLENFTSLQDLIVGRWFGNESTTPTNEYDDSFDRIIFPDEHERENTKKSKSQVASSSKTEENLSKSEKMTSEKRSERNLSATTVLVDETKILPPQEIRQAPIQVCQTGSCKQFASKLLSYMNHSADPCDDFYEYSCGGLVADQRINEKNLIRDVYDRIKNEARKEKRQSQIMEYYQSCIKYEENFDSYHRIDLAKESIEKIGKFYTRKDWPGNFQGFTKLFGNMLLQDRPLLFDIVPDVNEKNPQTFSLRIGPVVDENVFQTMHPENPCRDENLENLKNRVNLDDLYETYRRCKEDSSALVIAISQALKDLGIFEELNNTLNMTLYLEDTVTNIYHQIIEGALKHFPPQSEIKASYRSKNYTIMSLADLEATCEMFNWTELVKMVTGKNLNFDVELQIYNKVELTRALRHLEEFSHERSLELNNALLGLYARNLYRDLVAARSPKLLEKECFNVAVHYMQTEASILYLSSFTSENIGRMSNLMVDIFNELRVTLKSNLKDSKWAVDWGREVLLKKLDDMRISIPDTVHVKKNPVKLNMTDNYFENSLALMKKYRWTMYNVLDKNPNDPEQIWTFFASAYQSKPRTLYGLNLIAVPFGAIDWSILSESFGKIDYLSLATIGNAIAREMAHHFDTTGIRYWNASRDSEFALMNDDDYTKTNYEDYLNCHRETIYQYPMEMLLPFTEQHLTFTVPSLTLNDRLSDGVAMRLAHDTLARLGKDVSEKRLPWLDLDLGQLLYLVNAQTHCTKASLVSSYVSLHEDPLLPSRVRVFVAASNNKNLGKSWNCPEGSQLLPNFVCGIFPHLDN